MIGAGYNIYMVEDCCGATSAAAHQAALSRMVQAGAVRLDGHRRSPRMAARLGEPPSITMRSWASSSSTAALTACGVEYAYTMVHKAPQSARKPQVVPAKAH